MLASKKCVPCEGGVDALSPQKIDLLLADVPGWQLLVLDRAPAIARKFTFKNFEQSLAFVNKVGAIAEAEGHHPDITFGWGYATLTLYTHAIDGLHENDFIIAAKINAI